MCNTHSPSQRTGNRREGEGEGGRERGGRVRGEVEGRGGRGRKRRLLYGNIAYYLSIFWT